MVRSKLDQLRLQISWGISYKSTMKHLVALFAVILSASVHPVSAKTIAGTASVIDGDTIEVHGERIRLSAIDAIESHQPCVLPGGRQWRCGRDAAIALSDLIGRAPVSCAVTDVDRYGRSVGVCTSAGKDIGAWMVENGWALAYRRYGTEYVPAEARARKAGLGIWASEFEMPWDWRKKHR